MKLSKTLCYMLFIVTAVFSMPVLAVTPLGQIDSFDNIVGTGWTEPTGTGLMAQDNTTKHEGSGSIRVKFEDRGPSEWDVDLERVISLNLDYNEPNEVALTFWVNHNVAGDECVRELKVFQGDNVVRFAIPQMSAGWHKVAAPINLFTVVAGSSFNWAAVDRIQFFCSTWDKPGGSVRIDDLRLELVSSQMKLYQIDSMDNFIDPCDPAPPLAPDPDRNDNFWHDGRSMGYMKQSPPGEVNEGTGSMMIDFTMFPGLNFPAENGFDIEPVRNFQTELDFTHYEDLAITIWVWTDTINDSKLHQILLYDNADHSLRFEVPTSAVPGWRKMIAPLDDFTREGGGEPNWAAISSIGLWASCYTTPGNEIYMDDLCVEIAPVPPVPPFQIASFDDIADEGWYDDRHTGYMFQEANDVNVNEGTGSMRIAFAVYPGLNPLEKRDISVLLGLIPALDFNDIYKNWAITLWIWRDPAGDSQVNQIMLNDVENNTGRYNVSPPATAGWQKVTANLADFVWNEGWIAPDAARWDKIVSMELWAGCSIDPNINNSDIYYDDLRVEEAAETLSEAKIVNADRTFSPITVDGSAADWANLDDSDIVDFDLAAVPEPNGNLHVQYRLAWDPNYLYILVQEQPGDGEAVEAIQVGAKYDDWSLNDQLGGDYYYDNLSLYFDFTNNHWPGTQDSISLWLFLGLNSTGSTDMMMAWTNSGTIGQLKHRPAAIVGGSVATSGTLGSRITEAKVKWSVLAGHITSWRLPEGGLLAAIKPGYIFGCDPRLSDYELADIIADPPTAERGVAWLNGYMGGNPSGRDIYSIDVRLVCSAADLNGDCDVNFVDYAQFAEKWANAGCNNLNVFCNGADIVIDGTVNMIDLAELAQEWLSE